MKRDRREDLEPSRRSFLLGRFRRNEAEIGRGEALGPRPPCLALDPTGGESPCLDCAAPCITVCEPAIIRRHSGSHVLANEAFLDFSDHGCTYCGDCLSACPACDEKSLPPRRIGLALLDELSCMAWNDVICRSCAFACPERAITSDPKGRPTIVAESCNGCGVCLPLCPESSLSIVA